MKAKTTLLFILCISGLFLKAQWTAVNTGLTNNTVWSMTSQGASIFSGTDGAGVFTSSNNGNAWTATNSGLTSNYITAMASNSSTIFAGSNLGCVYVSTNNGGTWAAVCTSLPASGYVYCMTMSGSDVYAGIDHYIWKSTNNGATWSALNTSVASSNILSLAVRGSNIYAATAGGDVFVSTNGGTTWAAPNTGLPAGVAINAVDTMGTKVFAGTAGYGVYISSDNGSSWTSVNSGLSNPSVYTIKVSGNNIFVGTSSSVYISANSGSSWTDITSGLPAGYSVHSFLVDGGYAFAGTWVGGVYRRPLSEITSGINESVTDNMNIEVYPNPSSTVATIEINGLKNGKADLVIFDFTGNEVGRMKDISGESVSLQRDNLSDGIYFIRLMCENKIVATKKIILTN